MISAKCELVDQKELGHFQLVVGQPEQEIEIAAEEGTAGIAEVAGHIDAAVEAELVGTVEVVAVQVLVLVLASWLELALQLQLPLSSSSFGHQWEVLESQATLGLAQERSALVPLPTSLHQPACLEYSRAHCNARNRFWQVLVEAAHRMKRFESPSRLAVVY